MSAASVADLAQEWCFRGQVVTLELKEDLLLHDVHGLAPDEPDAPQDFFLLPLGATAKMTWLLSALELDCRFWRLRWREIPLVQEVRAKVLERKSYEGGRRKVRKCPEHIAVLKVRDRVIFASNDSRGPALAMKRGEEKEVLSWFLAEVRKDVAGLAETERSGGGAAPRAAPRGRRRSGPTRRRRWRPSRPTRTATTPPTCPPAAASRSSSATRPSVASRWRASRRSARWPSRPSSPTWGGEDRWAEVRAAFEACTYKALVFLDEGREDAPALADAPEGAPALLDE